MNPSKLSTEEIIDLIEERADEELGCRKTRLADASGTPAPSCPDCQCSLMRVTYNRDSLLNSEQFDAVRAGDWYCESCPGDRGNTGYRYFWNRELVLPLPPAITEAEETLALIQELRERLKTCG